MAAKAERQAKRRVRIVGGGFRYNRVPNGVKGGTMKAKRRLERKLKKAARKARKS